MTQTRAMWDMIDPMERDEDSPLSQHEYEWNLFPCQFCTSDIKIQYMKNKSNEKYLMGEVSIPRQGF